MLLKKSRVNYAYNNIKSTFTIIFTIISCFRQVSNAFLRSKAFIKQEFIEIKKRMCNITKRYDIFKISNTKIKAKKISKGFTMTYGNYKSSFVNFPNIRILLSSD